MKIGMLWLDVSKKRSLEEKVQRAADYYQRKYGSQPNLCLVHQGLLAEEKQLDTITIQPAPNILQGHFWVGIEGQG